MPVRTVDPARPEEDWEGNNVAVVCPSCRWVYIVSGLIHQGERSCPSCGTSRVRVTGGRESGGRAELEWSEQQPSVSSNSLGLTQVPERTFQHDLDVSERYQNFSSELLRLALLGLAGIGYLLVSLDPPTDKKASIILAHLKEIDSYLYVALFCFGACAAFSLAHRYFSADGLSYHLEYLRLSLRGAPEDSSRAKDERKSRNRRLKLGGFLLFAAALSIGLG